ncbi:uncharacterized protein LOC144648262 [Oculina patagonica]
MLMQTILSLSLGLVLGTSDAANSTTTSTKECLPATRERTLGVCIPYQAKFPKGSCKDILGYQPVYAINQKVLEMIDSAHSRYQVIKTFIRVTSSRNNATDNFYADRERCLEKENDMTCHNYFKRCYISSSPQLLCREACEDLIFNVCKREAKILADFVEQRRRSGSFDGFGAMNCSKMPFRNVSTNCYYPDEMRDKLNVLESQECFYGDGRGYRGNRSVTISGYTCQSWNDQCPHQHDINGTIYKELSGNLCRNPGGYALDGPWCFTTNRTVRWEYCDVPKCPKRPPSSPPANFRGHNTSSTSIKLTWGDVSKDLIHGILLGFHVACERVSNVSDRHVKHLGPTEHNWTFKRLHKYRNYSCWLRAYNNYRNGTWSEKLVISTDEDVPGSAPENLKVRNKNATSIHVEWDPIPLEYQFGKILEYKVEISAEERTRQKRKVTNNKYTKSRSLGLERLKKYNKYVISVSGLTRRGEGPARSLTVQVEGDGKNLSEICLLDNNGRSTKLTGYQKPDGSPGTSQIVSIVVAAVLPGTVALGAVSLVIYSVLKRKMSSSQFRSNNGSGCIVAPYAISSPDWIERIVNIHWNDDNVSATTHQRRYINIAADGSLDLPPHLRDIVFEFERLYENIRYKRLQQHRRRRSIGGAVDGRGKPVYDRLQREIFPTATCQGNRCSRGVQATATVKKEHKRHQSLDLGEQRELIGALQGNASDMEMTEMGTVKQRCRRRFSVDMGHVREFIALREMKTWTKEENTTLADQPQAQKECHNDATC